MQPTKGLCRWGETNRETVVTVCTMCSAGGHFPPHPQQDVSPDRKQYQARPYVWDQHFRREKPKSGGTTEQGAVPPTSTDVAPLKTQTEKTLPFSSAGSSS